MREEYNTPEIEIVNLSCEDIVTASNELPFEPYSYF